MPVERFFCDTNLVADTDCILDDPQEFHHLTHVIRCKLHDTVELVNGRNMLAHATLKSIEKKRALFHIVSVLEKPSQKTLILAQAIPRFPRLEWILEKGTELGASAFWLFPGEWSEKCVFSENQQQRMRLITISAMKQCGRLDLPAIHFKPPIKEWQPLPDSLFYGDTRASTSIPKPPLPLPATLLVGPERGLSPSELTALDHLQAQGIHLNDHILRTDTAALAFLTLFRAYGNV